MKRWLLFLFGLIAALFNHSQARSEQLIHVNNFLANVNLSEQKVFYVRNNLEGDIEFQESQNASLTVLVSGEEDELERVRVEYDLIDEGTIVDIQVFIVPESTTNWPLVGALVAGAGLFLIVVVIILFICVFKRLRAKQQHDLQAKGKQFEMRNHGKALLEIITVFENTREEEKMVDDEDGKSSRRSRNPSPWMERKIATFETPQPVAEDFGKGTSKTKEAEKNTKEITTFRWVKDEARRSHDPEVPRRARAPRTKSSALISARTAFMVLTLIAVALATTKTPSAKIVIRVPADFVRNGSKVFFNKDFHGRLLLSEGIKVKKQDFQQFVVSPASNKVSSLGKCSFSCEYACDRQSEICVCPRGYEMKAGSCQDIDECTSKKHNCHAQSTCNNTLGSFICRCKDGYWGDGITCKACSTKPCPENFYQSESCTRTRDRVCTACSPKCDMTTYEAYGCGLTFDRKCVDISKPLTLGKTSRDKDILDVRSGSRFIVLSPSDDLVLLEDRLRLNSTSKTFFLKTNSSNRVRLHRNSSFYVDVEIVQENLVPKYTDYDAWRSNGENLQFASVPGFPQVFNKYCRYPAPNHYIIKHVLGRDRQTKVYPAKCFQHSRRLCPNGVAPGQLYHYRSLNDACETAETSIVCSKLNQRDCVLQTSLDKLYCTNYTNIITDVFGVKKADFREKPSQSFPTDFCAHAYRACRMCRDKCSHCDQTKSDADSSCSCCYKECLLSCSGFYRESNCALIPKQCAKGDTSQFTLTMSKPADMKLQFNCYLQYNVPKTLYTLRYRVRHDRERFSSDWISKTLKTPSGNGIKSMIQQGKNRIDALEISHAVNFDAPNLLYLRGERASEKEPYKYRISSLESDDMSLGKANGTSAIDVQPKTPFLITTRTWSDSGNCRSLSEWSNMLRKPFSDFKPTEVDYLGIQTRGEVAYHVQDPNRTPTMTLSISEDESILKYVLTNATIRNDGTFKGSLTRTNTNWNARISGSLTTCPGFFSVEVIDSVDDVKVLEHDVVILCPETRFKVDIHVPRKSLQDKERLFLIRLTNAKQELELTLALLNKAARKDKKSVKKIRNEKQNPWKILTPLIVVTTCVLVSLLALIVYAQVTHKHENTSTDGPSRWKFVKIKGNVAIDKAGHGKEAIRPKDENRLKRRHLILVAFFVGCRVVYSVVFTFSMAFAILALLHADNMKKLQECQDFVQSKIDESNGLALQMDQHREREAKRLLDASEDIQRSCDFFLGLQLQWLRYNMTCLIQENHLKMFNKLSTKIVRKVTEKVDKLKDGIDERIKEFRWATRRQLQDVKENLKNYGKKVYKNGWFALPKGAYEIKMATSRKKREIAAKENSTQKLYYSKDVKFTVNLKNETMDLMKNKNKFFTRRKRSIADSDFIGFLDFVGAVDQEKLIQAENNIISELEYLKRGLADFSEVLKTGKSPEHPLSTILMCPLRYMLQSAKKHVQKGIQKLADEGEEWAKGKAECFAGNISDFFASNGSIKIHNGKNTDSGFVPERIVYEDLHGFHSTSNVSKASQSSVIESAQGGTYYNIEKGDIMEEMVDDQREELLERKGKIKNVTKIYDAQVFITTKKAVLGVLVVIDILLFIYRGSKTYQLAFKLIEGFEETVRHDEDEFDEEHSNVKGKAAKLLRRTLDFFAEKLSRFIAVCKTLQKRIMRTNLLPLCIIIAASTAMLYLMVALLYNVMNVTVIEELGGYDMIASRLDTDYRFTNLAIDDQVDFINNNAMDQYKESVNDSISEYNNMILDFNREQQERIERLNKQLCSLENNTNHRFEERASVLNFKLQSCIIPTLEGTHYEDYDGVAYRQQLKRESKRFVDAIRNIILETIYFILAVALSIVIISALAYVVFLFLKSRGMVRVKEVHVYKALPAEILEQFHLKPLETDGKQYGGNTHDKNVGHQKVTIPKLFLAESLDSVNTARDSKLNVATM